MLKKVEFWMKPIMAHIGSWFTLDGGLRLQSHWPDKIEIMRITEDAVGICENQYKQPLNDKQMYMPK